MDSMDLAIAVNELDFYINSLNITHFSVPVQASNTVRVMLVPADDFKTALVNNKPCFEFYSTEKCARLRRRYSATFLSPCFSDKRFFDSEYHNIKDLPKHHNSSARGYELVTCNTLQHYGYNAIHTGDDVSEVDVIADNMRIECKFGAAYLALRIKLNRGN